MLGLSWIPLADAGALNYKGEGQKNLAAFWGRPARSTLLKIPNLPPPDDRSVSTKHFPQKNYIFLKP